MTIARTAVRRTLAVAATAALAVGALAACSTGADATGGGSADDLDAALEAGGKLTYWSWTPSAEAQVAAFEEAYPNVDVELVNAGTDTEQYTKLQNAIKAGSGAPDVAQIEYYALPQFALADVARRPEPVRPRRARGRRTAPRRGARERRRQALRPAAGLRPDGAVLQQGGLRQVRHRRADHLGRVRRRRAPAARGRPDDVHHQRHRRRRLRHQHDLAGRRPPVRDRRHQRHDRPRGRGHRRSGPASGTSSSRRTCSRRLPAGATSGSRASATARSPRSSTAPGCPACSSRASPTPPATGASRRCRPTTAPR